MDTALAVDIGGTKLAAGLVTSEGEVVASATAPSRVDDAERLFSVLLALIDSVGGNGEVSVCGVGCGGPMTRGGEADGVVLALDDQGHVVHDGVEGLGERLDGAGRHPWCRRHGVVPRYLLWTWE